MTLRSAIQDIEDREDDKQEILADKTAFIAAWTHELAKLFDLMSDMLKSLREDGKISIATRKTRIAEDDLGSYEAPSLEISVSKFVIRALPIARITVGGRGRVDLLRDDRPSDQNRIRLLKGQGDEGWRIEQKRTEDALTQFTNRFAELMAPKVYNNLDPLNFESALEFLLRLK